MQTDQPALFRLLRDGVTDDQRLARIDEQRTESQGPEKCSVSIGSDATGDGCLVRVCRQNERSAPENRVLMARDVVQQRLDTLDGSLPCVLVELRVAVAPVQTPQSG